jgi:hypothetical protein
MLASNLELVRHILIETNFILQYVSGKTKDDVISDEPLCRAFNCEIVVRWQHRTEENKKGSELSRSLFCGEYRIRTDHLFTASEAL